jgi:hypothetical protein
MRRSRHRVDGLGLGVFVALAACLAAGCAPGPAEWARGEWCPSNRFVADFGGLPATAALASELGLSWLFVSGEIVSPTARYYFSGCELPLDPYSGAVAADVCWVEVVEVVSGQRLRAELRFHDRGFLFITDPFEGLYSTGYDFVCE